MPFNADEHVASLLPPVLITGGRKYRGKILSLEQVAKLWASPDARCADPRATTRFMRRCVKAWFPAPWPLRVLGINPTWLAFRHLPDATKIDAFESFSLVQRMSVPGAARGPLNRANQNPQSSTTTPTSSPPSLSAG